MIKMTLMTLVGVAIFSSGYSQMTREELEQGREAARERYQYMDPEEYFYREETKPPVNNQDPNYYLEDHPLQEEPLQEETVE